jgi:DNA-binding response OmpR family regulator
LNKKIVLIVDDEPMSVEILCHHLKNDYTVMLAHNGSEALEMISHTKPDIILLDLIMPEMDGYEVYKAIRRLPALDGIPVLFITALPDVECEAMGLEMGATDYIHKPFSADLVRLRIKNHLAFSQERSLLLQRSRELQEMNTKLEATLARVKMLEGIIPICMYCHKIRDDKGAWNRLVEYISAHSEALFSHGICPDCASEQKGRW